MFLVLSAALAGERTFAFSYGYGTVPKGGVEVEHYATAYGKDGGDRYFWEHQVELEYGITDRLEAGIYMVGGQWDAGPFAFRGYKARLRYRIGNQGVGIVDPNVYVEYIGNPTFDEHGVEAKLILAKTMGKVETALNVEYELEFDAAGVQKQEIEPTFGIGYFVAPWMAIVLESKFETYFRDTGIDGPFLFVGPGVHLAGEGGKFWMTLTAMAPATPLTIEDEGVTVRSLLAVNL